MRTAALLYHDVVEGDPEVSGFPGAGAARYKLGLDDFRAHLAALGASLPAPIAVETRDPANTSGAWLLTFDDGGRSAETAARMLEARGWRGWFFVTAGRIGHTAFLDAQQIRALAAAGHVVGSHSMSHPARISALRFADIHDEWRRSVATLEDVLGARVATASVPGGFFSRAVADAAAEAGIETLFNSEPVTRVRRIAGLTVVGRFALRSGDPPGRAVALASGAGTERARQWLTWNASKILKAVGGARYEAIRERLLRARRPHG